MKPIKILYINTSDGRGGAARLVMDLKDGIYKHGGFLTSLFVKEKYSNDQSVFCVKSKNRFLEKLGQILGKDVESFWHNKFHYLLSNDIEFFNNDSLLNSKPLAEADIVHAQNLHNNFFNLKLLSEISKTKPVIWSLHDMWALTPHEAWLIKGEGGKTLFSMETKPNLFFDNRKHLFETKMRIYDNSTLHIVSTSKWFERELEKSILKKHPHYLVHNGIDTEIYKNYDKSESRLELNLPQDKKIVSLMAAGGRHNSQKGWRYAEKVISHYANNPDVLFLCIGGKKEDVESNSPNLLFITYIDNESLFAKYYSASDVFLHPSMAEAFSLVMVQALSSGVPVVAFPVGIAEEAIKHRESGYIAKYQDTDDLIEGLTFVLDKSDEERQVMGKIGRETAISHFSKKTMIENHVKLYRQILENQK